MPEDREDNMKQRETQQVASVCVLWHEGETGRSYDDVAAAYFLYLNTAWRNVKNVTKWPHN